MKNVPKAVSEYFSKIGSKGASNGWKKLTSKQKTERAKAMRKARTDKETLHLSENN